MKENTTKQELVFKAVYEKLLEKVDFLKKNDLKGRINRDTDIKLVINDIRQCDFDVNGKRIVVGEVFFDPPSFFKMVFSLTISGGSYSNVLEVFGAVARYFKDNRSIDIGEYKYHNSELNEVYFSPVISDIDVNRKQSDEFVSFDLVYELRIGLNSLNSKEFVRTQHPAEVHGKVKK